MNTKNEKPILFSGEMVRALLDGRKTQTRRIVKPQPTEHVTGGTYNWKGRTAFQNMPIESLLDGCPHGRPGDRLCGKETFYPMPHLNAKAYFRASDPLVGVPRWKPSIFMPKALSRIKLEIESVRVERLQSISEDDAKAEGVSWTRGATMFSTPRSAYARLWESINGPGSWDKNPWVWVITFRRIGQ